MLMNRIPYQGDTEFDKNCTSLQGGAAKKYGFRIRAIRYLRIPYQGITAIRIPYQGDMGCDMKRIPYQGDTEFDIDRIPYQGSAAAAGGAAGCHLRPGCCAMLKLG